MNKQSIATDKWQKSKGYKVKGFKLKADLCKKFEEACAAASESQAQVITRFMEKYISENNNSGEPKL